ncbi:MAG: ABC-F type ribosomal protection protein [Erysipelotrichaceae bacterium]|nr:ABC-F type ribosomal protection protein [Erysipelotrichaceae bacterium]
MLYAISGGTVFFGPNEVFTDIDFTINENERIALIGRNGSGKTTLLKVMTGDVELIKGDIFRKRGTEIAYLQQHAFSDETRTIRDEFYSVFADLREKEKELNRLAEALKDDYSEASIERYARAQDEFRALGGYDYENEIKTVFGGFGFREEDLDRLIASFSGGERTKIAFARLLLKKPDLLLLDEPTNHLDLRTIEWLENYLASYKKAIVIVSHDRVFLDKTVQTVYELEYGSIKRYSGNYSSFVEQKQRDLELQERAYKRQQKEFKRIEDLIERFRYKKNKAAFAQSKIKYLERQEKVTDPRKADTKTFKAHFHSRLRGGKDVLSLDHFRFGYDPQHPLGEVTLNIHRGERICIMGDNGTGKSTLLKTIIGQLPSLGGYSLLGHQIEVGYFEQNLNRFHPEKTVLEEIWDDYPGLDKQAVRNVLGAFLFSADEVFKEVAVLSGGEKVRLSLAKLMLQEANFMILDEPTNHLDIVSKEALEEALKDYDGTVLFVSHDRYFIRKIADSCLVLENGEAHFYPDGYKDYLDERPKKAENSEKKEKTETAAKPAGKQKTQYDLRKIEAEIARLEEELEQKRELRFDPEYYQDSRKMQDLDSEIDDIHNRIHHRMEEWELAMAEDENKKK